MSITEHIPIQKIRQLPPQRLAEVEDFIDFLRSREEGNHLAQTASKTSEASFAEVWVNEEDAVYDNL